MLANNLKIYDHSNAVFFILTLPGIHGENGNSGALPCVWNPLTLWLPNGVLKQDLLDVSVATSFRNNNFGNL